MPASSTASDSCQLLAEWFAGCDRLVVIADDAMDSAEGDSARPAVAALWAGGLLTQRAYVCGADGGLHPLGVLVGHDAAGLDQLAEKYHGVSPERRPLLLHPYLPGGPALDVTGYQLPRPAPILPLLIRTGRYVHRPGGPDPSARSLLVALGSALGKELVFR